MYSFEKYFSFIDAYSKHVQNTPEDISTEDVRAKARRANLVRNKWMSEKRAKKATADKW